MLFDEFGEVVETRGDGKSQEEKAEYEAKIALLTISNASCEDIS